MAEIQEFSSSMSAPRSGNANLNITINGQATNYNPFGPDRAITIPAMENVFIDAPAAMDNPSTTTYSEGEPGEAKYARCMELLGAGYLPVCTGQHLGPEGTSGTFAPLCHIDASCTLHFYFKVIDETWKLNSSGTWMKV